MAVVGWKVHVEAVRGGGVGGWAGCNDLLGRQTSKSRTRVPAARVVAVTGAEVRAVAVTPGVLKTLKMTYNLDIESLELVGTFSCLHNSTMHTIWGCEKEKRDFTTVRLPISSVLHSCSAVE